METKHRMVAHMGIHVTDLSKTVDFYSSFFGRLPDKQEKGYVKYVLNDPGMVISFIEAHPDAVRPEFGHFGIRVEEEKDVDAWQQRVESRGMRTRSERNTECCYALQNKIWVRDPDGYEWEIYQFVDDSPVMSSSKEACCA